MSLGQAAYLVDPVAWVEAYGIIRSRTGAPETLDEKQKEVLRSDRRRIIVNCHRQWGKSSLCSAIVFHRALFYPGSLCLLVAPSLRQSLENFRKIIDSMEGFDPRPELVEDTKLSLKLTNGSRIISLPGSQKTIRGFSGPDLIVVDECAQADDELLTALLPMLTSNPAGRLILASTPFGKRGFFHRVWSGGGPEWLRVVVRAVDNPRLSPSFLEEMRDELGDFKYRQEFECEFLELESAFFTDLDPESIFTSSIEPLWGQAAESAVKVVGDAIKPLWSGETG